MRFFGILDVTDFGNQENLSLSLLHLQPAFGLLIVSFWHTQLGVEGFFFVWLHLLTDCCLLLFQVGLTASLLALIVERVVHAAKKNSIWSTAETLHYGKIFEYLSLWSEVQFLNIQKSKKIQEIQKPN